MDVLVPWGTKSGTGFKPWMTINIDPHTAQGLRVVESHDHKGGGDLLFARPLEWHLAMQVVAIDTSAA